MAELFAAFAGGVQASPVIAVGSAWITMTPKWLKEFAIRHFGTNDKPVLLIGLGSAIGVLAVAIGIIAKRHLAVGLAGFGALGVLGALAAVTRPAGGLTAMIPSIAGGLAGMVTLALLVHAMTRASVAEPTEEPHGADRRNLLLLGAGAVAVGGASGLGGRLLLGPKNVDAARNAVRVPGPASRAKAVPAGAQIRVPGMSRSSRPTLTSTVWTRP